jgi:hypothetical protein
MKKIVFILLLSFTLTDCILFKDSDLDPNGNLSTILALLGLQKLQSNEFRTILEMQMTNSSGVPYASHNVIFGKSDTTSVKTSTAKAIQYSTGNNSTNENGIVEIAMEGLGHYELILEDESNIQLASIWFVIFNGMNLSNLERMELTVMSGDLVVRILSVRQELIPKGPGLDNVILLGSRSGTIFGIGKLLSNTDDGQFSEMVLLVTQDGKNVSAIPIPDDGLKEMIPKSSFSTTYFYASNIVQTSPNRYFFLLEKVEWDGTATYSHYAVHTDGIGILEVYPVSKRGVGNDRINAKKIFYLANQLVYFEEYMGSPMLRIDDNFLRSASNNTASPVLGGSYDIYEHKGGIVHLNVSFDVQSTNNLSLQNFISFGTPPLPTYPGTPSTEKIYFGRNSAQLLQTGIISGASAIQVTSLTNDLFQDGYFNYVSSSTFNTQELPNPESRILEFGNYQCILASGQYNPSLFIGNGSNWVHQNPISSFGGYGYAENSFQENNDQLFLFRNRYFSGAKPELQTASSFDGVNWSNIERVNLILR